MTKPNVRIDRAKLGALTRLAAGGQGVVYSASGVRMQYASSLVYKEYKPAVLGTVDVSVLEEMPTYLETLAFSAGMELLSLAAWPCRLVEEAGVVTGFVMPAIPGEFFLDIQKASGVQKGPGEFQHLLNGDDFLMRRKIPLTDRHRYELVADVARALSVFHGHGIAVGDLSPKNLLFCIEPISKVFFIDCDAMRFKGRSVVTQLETPGWEVRAQNPGEELATTHSDTYKLGLLALRLFAGDQATRDVARLPRTVPREIRQLVSDGLDRRVATRPGPDDWVATCLAAAAKASASPPKARKPQVNQTGSGSKYPSATATGPALPSGSSRSGLAGGGVPARGVAASGSPSQRTGFGKWLLVAGLAAAALLVIPQILGSSSPSGGSSASGGSSPVSAQNPQSPSSASAPVWTGEGTGISLYSSDYSATVTSTVVTESTIAVYFSAVGLSDLRDPATSCVLVDESSGGSSSLSEVTSDFTIYQPGRYEGFLGFNLGSPGDYYFQYSCRDDYSRVYLGTLQ